MGRRTLSKRNQRTITKTGENSLYTTIPREMLDALGWEKGMVVKLKLHKSKRKISIEELTDEDKS